MSTVASSLEAAPRAELGRYDAILVAWRTPVFGSKAALAGLASILLAFWFNLDDPQWSLLTVFVTMAPQAGHVAAKGLARIAATFIGAVAALVLIGLFAQAPVFFLFGMSLWLALCTFAARSYRNNIAYAWVLAGFTAAIVGIGASDTPERVFDIAVARVSEITLGVGCAFFFGAVILPERLAAELLTVVQATRRDFVAYLHEILLPSTERVPVREARRRLMGGLITSDTIRGVVVFEEPPTAGYGAALAALNATLARAVVTAHTMDMQLRELRVTLPDTAREAFTQALGDAIRTIDRLPAWFGTSDRALATAEMFTEAAAREDERSRAAALGDDLAIVHYRLNRLFGWLAAYARASAAVLGRRDLLPDLPRTAFTPFRHVGLGLLGALRVMIIVPAAGLFWLASGNPANSGILVICSVFVAFMATVRHPDIAMRGILLGFCAAFPVAALLYFAVLPSASNALGLSAALIGPLLVCGCLLAKPDYRGHALGAVNMLAIPTGLQNQMTYDATTFLQTSFTTGLGLLIAMLGFSLLFPDTERFARRQLLSGVSSALNALLAGRSSLDAFTTSVFDLLNDFGSGLSESNERDRRLLEGGFGAISIGIELRRLHERLGLNISPACRQAIRALNDAARRLGDAPTPAALERTIALATAGAELARASTADGHAAIEDHRAALASFAAVADLLRRHEDFLLHRDVPPAPPTVAREGS